LEWVGTAIGNWYWLPEVPYLYIRSANPPAGVTVLYIILDLLVVTVCGWLWGDLGSESGAVAEGAGALPVPSLNVTEEQIKIRLELGK
jgi:hypothetical protein